MAIRKLQMAYELNWGVLPASGWVAIPGSKFTDGRKQNRVKPKIITGTRWGFNETRRANAEASCSLEMPLYYAMTCYPAALHFGAPVTAAAFTTAFTQTFKPGGSTMLSGTFQYMDTSSQNPGEWYQMRGVEFDSFKIADNAKGIPICTFQGFGKYPENISPPGTIATLAIEAYVHPDAATHYIKKSNVAWAKVQKVEIESVQGLEPDWTIQASTSISRIKLGEASGTIKATAFRDDYTGSILEVNDGSGLITTPGLEIGWIDPVTVIGTAGSPSVVVTAPLPYVDDASMNDTESDSEEDFSISLAYDGATASGWKFVWTNMLPASTFVGH